jgi:hypothetical protein
VEVAPNPSAGAGLHAAKLRGNACVEDIDFRTSGGLDKSSIRAMAQESGWLLNHEYLFVLGPTFGSIPASFRTATKKAFPSLFSPIKRSPSASDDIHGAHDGGVRSSSSRCSITVTSVETERGGYGFLQGSRRLSATNPALHCIINMHGYGRYSIK